MIPTSTCDFSNVRTIASSAVLRPDFDGPPSMNSGRRARSGPSAAEVVATDTHHREHGRFVAREVAEGGLQGEARRQDVDAEGSPTPGYRSVPPSGARSDLTYGCRLSLPGELPGEHRYLGSSNSLGLESAAVDDAVGSLRGLSPSVV